MIRILFQGDSITDGARFRDVEKRWDLNHQIGHSYVFTVASLLGKKYPGKYFFINRGIGGDTIQCLAARWQVDALDENPDVLSILVGINGNANRDGYFPEGEEVNVQNFENTYREILNSSRAHNPKVKFVLIEPFFLPVGTYKEHYNDFMKVFTKKQAIVEKLAKEFDAIFIPTQKRLEKLVVDCEASLKENGCTCGANEYWLWDGIHPTEAFHGFLAEWWIDATKSIL